MSYANTRPGQIWSNDQEGKDTRPVFNQFFKYFIEPALPG